MFQSALIVEDHQSSNQWIQQILKDLGVMTVKYAYYCDDALLMLKRALEDNTPFDLLLTDLSFDEDGRVQQLRNGAMLIEAAKNLQPDLRVLVFSAEPDPAVVGNLFKQLDINGYVHKGRRDMTDLKTAVEYIHQHKKFVPAEFQQAVRSKNAHDFSTYDIQIISLLAQGTLQKNIPAILQQSGAKATSLSSVEKRLNQIRETLGFTKNEQLVAYCKDHKVI
ncbi:transcriptional regulator [Mucilaginibacter sp. PPCGB 2223]|uniref:response regulator n=1 Tax=Mucilaginibacter sp. PPCGB 2223 TaxID=1886027 RepID=UPI00082658D5|nr:response regulator [Mucilaginibacter sp. PPCGB 2223]OCX54267.1 transcriptional regulator [Mucilaginibacter sp. PPCGB 2223]